VILNENKQYAPADNGNLTMSPTAFSGLYQMDFCSRRNNHSCSLRSRDRQQKIVQIVAQYVDVRAQGGVCENRGFYHDTNVVVLKK
jgi:hypothetical protein